MRKKRLLDPGRAHQVKIARSRKQELRVARKHGGRVTPGSGNQWHTKGDVSTREYLIECKRTDKGQYVLKEKELKQYRARAVLAGKRFMMQIEIGGETYVLTHGDDYEYADDAES